MLFTLGRQETRQLTKETVEDKRQGSRDKTRQQTKDKAADKRQGSRKNYCTLWNSQGARLMSLFSTIISLRKTTLRRYIIVENKDITLAPWLLNTRQDRQDKTGQDKTRQDKTRHLLLRTRQDRTRQDKTRQDKTGQAQEQVGSDTQRRRGEKQKKRQKRREGVVHFWPEIYRRS